MILYKYTADCSKLNLEQEDSTKEGYERLYSRRSRFVFGEQYV